MRSIGIAAAPLISSSFPFPITVAGSGLSRDCRTSPTTSAPAEVASSRSSASDSSAENANHSSLSFSDKVGAGDPPALERDEAALACSATFDRLRLL